jgi:tRNA threonylcarbamoyladenosine modification (KEOPS) complex  Pcc1 subunit
MSQDERTEIFLHALNYYLGYDDEDYMYGMDSEEEDGYADAQSLFSASPSETSYEPQEFYEPNTAHDTYSPYEAQEVSEPYSAYDTHEYNDAHEYSDMNADFETNDEWFDDEHFPEQEEMPAARHTLTPTFSASPTRANQGQQKKVSGEQNELDKRPASKSGVKLDNKPKEYQTARQRAADSAQLRAAASTRLRAADSTQSRATATASTVGYQHQKNEKMPGTRPPAQAAAKRARERKPAQPVVQPEIKDVALDEIFSDAPGAMNRNLRGLDFLLQNVIGEENDEAVLEAIRRKRTITSH